MAVATLTFPAPPYPISGALASLVRTDTGQSVLGDGSLVGSGGSWTLTIAEPLPGLTYAYIIAFTFTFGVGDAIGTVTGDGTPAAGSPKPYAQIIVVGQGSTPILPFPYVDANGNPINLAGKELSFAVWSSPDGGQTTNNIFALSNRDIGGITVSGAGNNVVNVHLTQGDTSTLLVDGASYTLSDVTDGLVIAYGAFSISPAVILAVAS